MSEKLFSHRTLYDNGEAFFRLKGNASMKLSPKAAIEVCEEATRRGIFISVIEAGYWHNPGFQPDMHHRWDSKTRLEREGNFKRNNELAIENIDEDTSEGYTAFIITIVNI